jgi:hypothetical protein
MSVENWFAKYSDELKEAEYGPFESKLDALIACFPEVRIWQETVEVEAESISEAISNNINTLFLDKEKFPCDVPSKRVTAVTT